MKRRYTLGLALAFLLLILAACKSKTVTPAGPDIGIPVEEMNSKIELSVPDGWNTFKIGNDVGIVVKVISNEQVAFSSDFGARLFIHDHGEWVEIPNFTRYPEGTIVLSPAGSDPFKNGATGVFPLLPEENRPVTVRIYLVGHIYKDGQITPEATAAYIDVELKPQ